MEMVNEEAAKENIGGYVSPDQAKASTILLAIYGFNCALNFISILLNAALVAVTIRNRQLHGICQVLIGYCACCNILLECCEPIYFLITLIPSIPSVPIFQCFFIQFLPLFGFFNVPAMILVIGIDRIISIFTPLWHIQYTGRLYLCAMMALSALYPSTILAIVFMKIQQERADHPGLCTISDLLADNTSLLMTSALCISLLSICCYMVFWAKLLWDLRHRGANEESSSPHQHIFRSLLIILAVQVAGWSISELGLVLIYRLDGMTPLVQRQWAAATNILLCLSAGTDPIVLYLNSDEHRKAFCRQFPWIFRASSQSHSSQVVACGPMVAWKTNNNNVIFHNNNNNSSSNNGGRARGS